MLLSITEGYLLLIALIDCLNYLVEKGPYSKDKIMSKSGRLATVKNFQKSDINLGDAIFFHPRGSLFSWLIMYWTNGIWSHVAMGSSEGTIIHATPKGVIEEPISNYLDGKSYLCVLKGVGLVGQSSTELQNRMLSILGSKYAWGKAAFLGLLILHNYAGGYRFRLSLDFILIPYFMVVLFSNNTNFIVISSIVVVIHFLILASSLLKRGNVGSL